MSKPQNIPQWAWDEALLAYGHTLKCDPEPEWIPDIERIARALLAAYERGRGEQDWQPIETAPKCDLHPYDKRASEGSAFVLIWNGFHIGVGYYQIDDDDPIDGGFWCSETGEFIEPAPTRWKPLPGTPTEAPT